MWYKAAAIPSMVTTMATPPYSHPTFQQDPLQASNILTPLRYATWQGHLRPHPHQDLVQYFLQGISTGFRIEFDGSSTQSAKNNMKSAVDHPAVIDDCLHDELSVGRISGPYMPSMCPYVHINRFGVIPKNHHNFRLKQLSTTTKAFHDYSTGV